MNVREVKERLNKVRKIDSIIKHRIEDIKVAEARCQYPSAPKYGERISGANGNSVEDSIIEYISLRDQYKEDLENLKRERTEIIRMIEQLPIKEYEVIYQRYIELKDYFEIADNLGMSYSSVTTIHGRALKNLANIS